MPETTRQLWRWLELRMPCGMLAAAMTPQSRMPQPSAVGAWLLLAGRRTTEEMAQDPFQKSPSLRLRFISFSNPWIWHVQIPHLLRQQSPQVLYPLFLVGKLKHRWTFTGSAANPAHTTATAMNFPANAGLIFLTDELTNDRYLVTLEQH